MGTNTGSSTKAVPLGTLGYAQTSSNQGPTAPPFDITGATVTVTVGPGRRIKITGVVLLSSSVTTDLPQLQINEGATLIYAVDGPALAGNGQTLCATTVLTPSAGSHTYKLTATRVSGSGNFTINSATGWNCYILVEDIGT
jgi:hypothetical protein